MTREEATRRNTMPNELKSCPSCGCYKIGTVQCVDEVEMGKEAADGTERTN